MKKLVLFVLIILLLASCGPRQEDQVIGTWERVEGELWPSVVQVQLSPDGAASVTVVEGQDLEDRPYEWSIEGGDFCENWNSPQLTCYQMDLNEDIMTLLDVRANSVTLRKIE
jgi:hypothetical protein